MSRALVVWCLIVSLFFTGCSSTRNVSVAPANDVSSPDFWKEAPQAAEEPPSWWDEHPVAKYGGITLLAVGGGMAVIIAGALVALSK